VLLSQIHKESLKVNDINIPITKMGKYQNKYPTQKDIQMANKHIKDADYYI
jgi:hypothetical protein